MKPTLEVRCNASRRSLSLQWGKALELQRNPSNPEKNKIQKGEGAEGAGGKPAAEGGVRPRPSRECRNTRASGGPVSLQTPGDVLL